MSERSPSLACNFWDVTDENLPVAGGFFPDQEWNIPGNPKILKVFPARKSLVSVDLILLFNSVGALTLG